jgi:hypothetical protein
MANPLTYRQKAKIHEDESGIFDALAKAKRQEANTARQALDSNSTEQSRLAVIALYEKAIYYCQMGESQTAQQLLDTAAADAAGEPP